MTTLRSGSTRTARLAASLALVLGLASMAAACAPTPPVDAVAIRCEPLTTRVTTTPAITFDPKPLDLSSVRRGSSAACVDGTGRGISSVRFDGLDLHFPETSCLPEPGTSGFGTASVSWSDGSTSLISVRAVYDGPFSGTLELAVLGGTFSRYEGTGEFTASPTAGSCYEDGITRAVVTASGVGLTSPTDD